MIKHLLKRIAIFVVAVPILLMLTGMTYQWISTKLDDHRYPPPGKMVDIGGYCLHLKCVGEGGPTVILEAGGGCNSLDWSLVQPEVAKFTHVCSYDRAGYGWSDTSPLPRTSRNIVDELHALLQTAKVPGPYIFVGHSFGGVNVLLYANTYPEDVAGVILVDASHEDQLEGDNSEPPDLTLAKFSSYIGVTRLWSSPTDVPAMLPPEIQKAYAAKVLGNKFINTMSEELQNAKTSFAQLKETGGMLGEKPLIVIAAGRASMDESSEYDEWFEISSAFQKAHVKRSSNGKLIIAEQSDHMIPHNQPDVIVKAIKEMVDQHNF